MGLINIGRQEGNNKVIAKLPVSLYFFKGGRFRARGGEALHGFLIEEISKVDKTYATYLHELKKPKPFSISPLILKQKEEVKDGLLYIKKGDYAEFFISCFDNLTLEVVLRAFAYRIREKSEVKIGEASAIIKELGVSRKGGGKVTTFNNLIHDTHPVQEVTFRFITPTSFRQSGIQFPFPLPNMVFSSIMKVWKTYADTKFGEQIREKLDRVAISKFRLSSEIWSFSSYKVMGCKGEIQYVFKEEFFSEEEIRILCALSKFASFSGVGYKRTMGMGVVEVELR